MGSKRKDAAKKEEKAEPTRREATPEALTNGTYAAPAGKEASKGTASMEKAAATDTLATVEKPAPKHAKAAKSALSELTTTTGQVAKAVKGATSDAAVQVKQQVAAAADALPREKTDVALVLSVINSLVLLALLGGLGAAGWLARAGQLESTLTALAALGSGGPSDGFFALSATDIDGAHVPMRRFAGRLVIVVNVASNDHVRGYTKQNYARLNYIYEKYKSRGLEILAFPCNQFGGLEPGTNAAIKHDVQTTYNATFPLFAKVDVKGPGAHPVWRFLLANQPTDHGYPAEIDWNFNKFVVSKLGWPLVRYPLTFDGEDLEGIEGWISPVKACGSHVGVPALQHSQELDDAFTGMADADGHMSMAGFGSLLSIDSARSTFPDLKNFRVRKVVGFQRVFAHTAPVFFERGIARPETGEISSISCEEAPGASIVVSVFEIPHTPEMCAAVLDREHEFRFLAVRPLPLDAAANPGDAEPDPLAVICGRWDDESYKARRCPPEEFHRRFAVHGVDRVWRDDVLPCRTYLRHCVLAARRLGPEAEASFLDATFLADRTTTVRQWLEQRPEIMEELPPPSLAARYSG